MLLSVRIGDLITLLIIAKGAQCKDAYVPESIEIGPYRLVNEKKSQTTFFFSCYTWVCQQSIMYKTGHEISGPTKGK